MPTPQQCKDEIIERIAREVLNVPTLEVRGRDALDFHELSVSSIHRALELAYDAGCVAGGK